MTDDDWRALTGPRLFVELAVYGLALVWWIVQAAFGVGSDAVQLPVETKVGLSLGAAVVGLSASLLLLLRYASVPGDAPTARLVSVIVGSVCLSLFACCSGCGVFTMWYWN